MSDVRPKPLKTAEIEAALSILEGWSGDQQSLKRKLVFKEFRGAMKFMQACIEGIEERDHHPNWCNTYNSIEVHLNTHSAGHRVTEKDINLAEFIDSVLRANRAEFGYLRG
jgi:4a-hydroxytetrahydrobiopterin dehydratase